MDSASEKFEALYKKYYPLVQGYFRKRTGETDAEDLTQQTFMNLWLWLIKPKDIKSEKSFVFTIAKNVLADYFRAKRLSTEDIDIESLFDLSDGSDFTKGIELREAIGRLPERERAILQLKSDGYNSKEIGKLLGILPSTVRGILEKIRKKLKQEI